MDQSAKQAFDGAAGISDEIEIRQFRQDEWAEFKRVRLLALAQDGSKFKAEAREELTYSDAQWQARTNDPDNCILGVFIKGTNTAIGLNIASINPENREMLDVGSLWIDPAQRRKNITMLMYATFLDWGKDKPELKYVEISHRAENKSTKILAAKYGFTLDHIEQDVVWFDRTVADKVFYTWKIPSSLFTAAKPSSPKTP